MLGCRYLAVERQAEEVAQGAVHQDRDRNTRHLRQIRVRERAGQVV